MKNMTKIIAALAGLTLLGCVRMGGGSLPLEVNSSSWAKVTNADAHAHGGGVHVVASLRPTTSASTRTGHVHVEFLAEDGSVLESVEAKPNVSQFSRNSSSRPAISVHSELKPGQVASVRLTHHVEGE